MTEHREEDGGEEPLHTPLAEYLPHRSFHDRVLDGGVDA